MLLVDAIARPNCVDHEATLLGTSVTFKTRDGELKEYFFAGEWAPGFPYLGYAEISVNPQDMLAWNG